MPDIQQLVERVRQQLQQADIFVLDTEPVQHGIRLHLHNDGLVLVYNSGKVVVQGKNQDTTKTALASGAPAALPAEKAGAHTRRSTTLAPDVQRALAEAWHRCTGCGALMPRLWRFCVACGAESFYERRAFACSSCGQELDTAWLHCPACGSTRG